MDTKKLRQKVLDLAIHGKLVKQDPNDEPASILLDRIRAEKAQLVKEGKIKKSDLIEKPISEDEIPFEVPEGWEWCRLAAIINMLSGQDFPPSKYNDKGLGIPYITGASNIQDAKILVNRWTETPTVIAKQNDLLIVCKGSGVGKMAICNIELGHIARQIQALRNTYKLANLQYIRYVIEVNLRPIISNANGIIPGLPRDILLDLILPLPPLSEQHRIVKAVDELFEQIDIIERSEKELEEAANKTRDKLLNLAIQGHLVQQDPNEEPASVLLERIRAEEARLVKEGKLKKKDLEEKPISPDEIPFDIPEGWVWTCMKECNYFMSSQEDPTKKPEKQYELYSVPTFETGMPEFVKGKEISSSKVIVQKNDVLLCKINPHLNRSWVVSHYNEELPCIASSEWIVFRNHYIYPKYLRYCFISPYFKNLMMSNVSGVGGSLMRAQPVSVAKYLFPLPPLSEQRRIVTKLEELLQEIDKLKA